jgi:hypothetical protein
MKAINIIFYLFIALMLGRATVKLWDKNYKPNTDYYLQLDQSGKIKVSDKQNNEHLIELDSLEEFIIQDNL